MNDAKTIHTNKTIAKSGSLLDIPASELATVEGGIEIRYEDFVYPKYPDIDTSPLFSRSWQPIA